MRLCYVVHQFFPWAQSGTEQYCLATAREARRRGHDVTVLSLYWDHDRVDPEVQLFDEPYDGFRVLRLNHSRRVNPNDVLRDYENRHLESWFRTALDDVRPDAVHVFHLRQLGSNLIPVARAAGCRVVVSLMDFWFLCPRFTLLRGDGALCDGPPDGGAGCVPCLHPELAGVVAAASPCTPASDPPSRLRALLDRPQRQLRHLAEADAVFAPSRFLADMFAGNGFDPRRLEVVPYGLDPDRIRPLPAARPRRPLRTAFCGVLSPWKAPHVAVEAVRAIAADIELRVHGRVDEPMFRDYIAGVVAAAAGDPRIRFVGPYREEQAAAVFSDMDVLIVPSTWYENTPFVVLEAFAAGVPVVASDLGGLSELVRHGENGMLFPAGDAKALAATLRRLADEPDLHTRLRPSPPPTIAASFDRFATEYAR